MKHHKPPQPHEEFPLAYPFANATNNPLAEAMGKGASFFGRSFSTLQKEGLRFMNERIQENMKAAETFGACRSLPDLFAAQQRWFADMARAYTDEWQRCSALMSEMAQEKAEEGEAPHRRPLHTEQPH